jgi:hypothetical protein
MKQLFGWIAAGIALTLVGLIVQLPTQAKTTPTDWATITGPATFPIWLPLYQHDAWMTGPIGGAIVWTPTITHWVEPGESKYMIRYTGNGWVGRIWLDDGYVATSWPICTACPDVVYTPTHIPLAHLRVGVQTLDPYVESSIWDIEIKVGQ